MKQLRNLSDENKNSQADKAITRQQRKRHSRRVAIEPVISHLKFDYRLIRNFLKGTEGASINLLLSAAAFNFKRVIDPMAYRGTFTLETYLQLADKCSQEIFCLKRESEFLAVD